MEQVPCRVSADLRQHQADQDRVDPALEIPDFADTDAYEGVVSKDLHDPLARLFSTRDQILQLQRSEAFRSALNKDKSLEWLLRDLAALERSLYQIWCNA